MIPYRLLFNIGSKAAGTFMQRRREKSERKHAIALAEMETGNERAKRNGSGCHEPMVVAFINDVWAYRQGFST